MYSPPKKPATPKLSVNRMPGARKRRKSIPQDKAQKSKSQSKPRNGIEKRLGRIERQIAAINKALGIDVYNSQVEKEG